MGDGYVRQSTADIIAGEVVEAAPLNAEFNQIQSAFNLSSGHSHDGTTGEGPKISLTTSTTGILPVAQGGIGGIHNVAATTAPTVNDDVDGGYVVGSQWLDTTNDTAYICVDNTDGAAVWLYMGSTTGWQPLDAELTAIAGLTSAADRGIYFTGAGTASLFTLTAAGRALLDDSDAATQLATLGLTATASELNALDGITATVTELNYTDGVTSAIQTQLDAKQAADGDLTALAALSGTNTIYYRSGSDTWSPVTIDSSLDFTAGTLSVVAASIDPELGAIAGLTSAADKIPYFTGSGTASLADFPASARTAFTAGFSANVLSFLDDANFSAMRTTLGVAIGSDVQAYDADLTIWAGLTPSANAQSLVTAANYAAMRALLDLEAGTDFYSVSAADAAFRPLSPRVTSTASSSTPTPNADTTDQYNLTALATNATFGAPTGTPSDGQKLMIRFKDNSTVRTIAWNSAYRAMGITLPTTTVDDKTTYVGFIWNAADSKWDGVATVTEA